MNLLKMVDLLSIQANCCIQIGILLTTFICPSTHHTYRRQSSNAMHNLIFECDYLILISIFVHLSTMFKFRIIYKWFAEKCEIKSPIIWWMQSIYVQLMQKWCIKIEYSIKSTLIKRKQLKNSIIISNISLFYLSSTRSLSLCFYSLRSIPSILSSLECDDG